MQDDQSSGAKHKNSSEYPSLSMSRRRHEERRALNETNGRKRVNNASLSRKPLNPKSHNSLAEQENGSATSTQQEFINELLSCFDNELNDHELNQKLSILTLRRLGKSTEQNHAVNKKPTPPGPSENGHQSQVVPDSLRGKSPPISPEELMPDMGYSIQDALNNVSPNYRTIASKAAKEQEMVQTVFRNMRHVLALKPPSDIGFTIPAAPLEPPYLDELETFELPTRQPGASLTDNEHLPIQIDEEACRKARLEALGIFDIAPKSKQQKPKTQVTQTPIMSFSTPTHQKADKRDKIDNITMPILVSTSSTVQTVPIHEIMKDLKTLGRLQ